VTTNDLLYSPTGNGFISDEFGNKFTFNKVQARSYTRPDFGDVKGESIVVEKKSLARDKLSAEDVLASL
jgi:hypothetical protein